MLTDLTDKLLVFSVTPLAGLEAMGGVMELMLLVGFLTVMSVVLGCVRKRRCQPKHRAAGGLPSSTSFPTVVW